MTRSLRIAQVAPPFERVPPRAYGGTERIVHGLVTELDRRGHEVTTFASGDSVVPGRHIETVPEALRPLGYAGDSLPYMQLTLHEVLARATEFDLIHAHLEWASLLLARVSPVPVVTTFHGRLDLPWADALLRDPPDGLVAISENQAGTHPDVPWAAVVHNGLRLTEMPFGSKRTRRAVLRRTGGAREGDRRGDRDRQGGRSPAAHRGQGRPDGPGARLFRERVPARR